MAEDEGLLPGTELVAKSALREVDKMLGVGQKEAVERQEQDKITYSRLLGHLGTPQKGRYTETGAIVLSGNLGGVVNSSSSPTFKEIDSKNLGLPEEFKNPRPNARGDLTVLARRPSTGRNELDNKVFVVVEGNVLTKTSSINSYGELVKPQSVLGKRAYMLDSDGKTTVTESWGEWTERNSMSALVTNGRIIDVDVPKDFWPKVYEQVAMPSK